MKRLMKLDQVLKQMSKTMVNLRRFLRTTAPLLVDIVAIIAIIHRTPK
jgi:hypothetical protein